VPNIHGPSRELSMVQSAALDKAVSILGSKSCRGVYLVGSREYQQSYISKKMWGYCAPIICNKLGEPEYANTVLRLYKDLDRLAHELGLNSNQLIELADIKSYASNRRFIVEMLAQDLAADYDVVIQGVQFDTEFENNIPIDECGAYIDFHSDIR
jgi:hypothetical protein